MSENKDKDIDYNNTIIETFEDLNLKENLLRRYLWEWI